MVSLWTSLVRTLRLLWHVRRGGEARAAALLELRRPSGLFQPFGQTLYGRYPVVFAFVKARLQEGPHLQILSFGCSTGEEVFTLRHYFPEASITGIDISAGRIAACRRALKRRGGDAKIIFMHAAGTQDLASQSFDAIFALSVFRHGSLSTFPPTCRHSVRFAEFERAVAELVRCLKPDGFIAFRHSNFRFTDTPAGADFECLLRRPHPPETPVYDRNDQLLPARAEEDVVFQRQGAAGSERVYVS